MEKNDLVNNLPSEDDLTACSDWFYKVKRIAEIKKDYELIKRTEEAILFLSSKSRRFEYISKISSHLKVYYLNKENKDMESKKNVENKKVFVVHGHNEALKEQVARLLEKQGLEPIILNEQTNQGRTIIEKIEQNNDVQAAICLFTFDDQGKSRNEKKYNNRARQNVVFETGYFFGLLGRGRLIIIADDELELPSDMQGVVYTNINWKFEILKELKNQGFAIDLNKI